MSLDSAGLSRQKYSVIRQHASTIANLPEPGTIWMANEVEPTIKHILKGLRLNGIVNHVESTYNQEAGQNVWKWKTDEESYRVACGLVGPGSDALLPCGHNSIQNERGVEGITCGVCGTVHPKSEVNP
jgi:hypothetical protein